MLHFSPDIHVGYEYRLNVEEGKTQRAGAEGSARFIEHCWQEKAGARTELWRVENGVLRYASGNEVRLGPQTGLLSGEDGQGSDETSQVANALVRLLGFKIIHAGVPRAAAGDDRRDLFVRVRKSSRDPSTGLFDRINTHTDRLDKIASSIVYLYEDAITELDPPQKSFEEISSAVQRIGLAKKLDVQLYGPVPGSSRRNGEEEWIAEAKLDGVNIGRASDGTCRTLETLLHLFRPGEWLVPLLLEEPETGIHPSLLQRLLHELEAYEGQLIISTHSPQVVSWAKPEEIRIVERRDGKTTVRPLAPSQVESVHGYLADDGTLGEFVYGGALDDEV